MSTPEITIFVRHSAGCKHAGDEFARRCQCRKHFRWTMNGKQYRRQSGTRSWTEAEEAKLQLVKELQGGGEAAEAKSIREAIDVFLKDKRVQGVAHDTVGKFTLELNRFADFCERQRIFRVKALNREALTHYFATWPAVYPSSVTRSKVRERLKTFLRYCYEAEWLPRVPSLPKIQVDEPPTLPLSSEEYDRLLAAIPEAHPDDPKNPHRTEQRLRKRRRVRGLFLLMRWTGLAIGDALGLPRREIRKERGFYRVVTSRQKTGTDVSVALRSDIAEEILATPNDHPEYLFWSGNSDRGNHATQWQTRYIAPVFKAAGLYDDSAHMVSHRLRDTFAVDLLEKGVPLEEVSKLLGHESIKTTEKHYAKWVKGRQDRLDNLVMGTWS